MIGHRFRKGKGRRAIRQIDQPTERDQRTVRRAGPLGQQIGDHRKRGVRTYRRHHVILDLPGHQAGHQFIRRITLRIRGPRTRRNRLSQLVIGHPRIFAEPRKARF